MIKAIYDLDMTPMRTLPIIINVSQYDDLGRTLVFNLFSSSGKWTAPTSAAVTFEGGKPDGKFFSYNCAYSNGTVTVTIQQQMTAVAGKVRCKIKVKSGDKVVESAPIIMVVDAAAVPDGSDMSKSDINDAIANATQKIVDQVKDSIPSDYSQLSTDVSSLKQDLEDWTGEKKHNPVWTKERVSSSGVISANGYYLLSDILNPNGEKISVKFVGVDKNVKCFAAQWTTSGVFVGGSVSPIMTEDFVIDNGNVIRIQAFYNTTSTNISPYEEIVKSSFKITIGSTKDGYSYNISKEALKEVLKIERPMRDILLVIPDKFWIDKTKKQAVYLDNVMFNGSYKEVYSKSSYKAKYEFDEGFIYENTNSGQDIINIDFLNNRKSITAVPNIISYTPSQISGVKKILIIGDSLTASGRYPRTLQTNLKSMGMETEFIGTVGTTVSTVKHEGHAGWRAYTYAYCAKGSDDYANLTGDNPFYSTSAGRFQFSHYMVTNGFNSLDAVVLAIGTNDTIRDNHTSDDEILRYYHLIIDSIKQYDENIKIFIWLEPLRALTNHSYTMRDKAFVNVINKLQHFQGDNQYSQKVTLLPIGMFIDPYSYPTTKMEISAVTQKTFDYISDTVHGENDWIFQNQIADAMATSLYYNLIN